MIRSLRAVLGLVPAPRGRLALAVTLGALTIMFGVGLMATAGYLIARAAERPAMLSLMVAIVAVRFFGLGRPVVRYLGAPQLARPRAPRARTGADAVLRADRAARARAARLLPQRRPALADRRRCRRAPEPLPAGRRPAAGGAARGRGIGRSRGGFPARRRDRAGGGAACRRDPRTVRRRVTRAPSARAPGSGARGALG